MARRLRRRRANPELRMAYGGLVRTLGRAILDLVPPPEAPCGGCWRVTSGCLLCRRWAHLLRDDDPVAYRRLLTLAVCALDPAAPPPPRHTLGSVFQTQAQPVEFTIYTILKERNTTNVLSNGGGKGGLAQDLVSSSSWDLLLQRIGDMLMCYILKHFSIFLPVRKADYLQVTGVPVNHVLKQRIAIQRSKSRSTDEEEYETLMDMDRKKCPICYDLWRNARLAQDAYNKDAYTAALNCPTQTNRKRKRLHSWQRRCKQKQASNEDRATAAQKAAQQTPSPSPKSGPICFSCLMLHASKCVPVDSVIQRRGIFYSTKISKNVFNPINLSNKKKGPDAALSHIKRVFGIKDCCIKFLHCECGESSTTHPNCLYHWLLQQVKNLIRNSKHCQYMKLFKKHCPAKSKVVEDRFPSANVAKNEGSTQYCDGSLAQLEAYSTHQEVESFVWAVLTRIIPEPLLGNPSSKRSLRKSIWKFVSSRRFATFQVTDCIGELKVSYYSWLTKIGSAGCSCSVPVRNVTGVLSGMEEEKQSNLLRCWIRWLFSGIVIPLINTYFYVTERETKQHYIFYYPKSVWRNLTSNAIASLNKENFTTLCGASRRESRHLYRPSKVRFLPNEKGVRPLVHFKAQSKDGVLSQCHLVLEKVRDENPEMVGSSVFDYNNIHRKLSSFISPLKGQLKEPEIYIVVADISKVFDCIDHEKLLEVMNDVLKGDEYDLRNCKKVVYSSSKNAVYRFDSNVSVSNGNNIHDFLIQSSSRGGILVDQGTVSTIRKENLDRVLAEQVKYNIVKLGQNFCLQKVGIAQGNKLSTHLCSLYYGNLENSVIPKLLRDANINSEDAVSVVPEHLLMRFIGDFMFISSSKELALTFFKRIRRGFVYYNSNMDGNKYGLNFKVGSSEDSHNRMYSGDDGVSFMPWSGLLINCETLEVQADYTRYSGITIKSTITVEMHCSIKDLGRKLCEYMNPKCHPIFYDSKINSSGTVRLNLYQAFLLCAMRFHCHIGSLGGNISKPEELLPMIEGTFRYTYGNIVSRMEGSKLQSDVPPVLELGRKETRWLGLSAYIRVLGKKQTRYKDLLAALIKEAEGYVRMEGICQSLRYAVDESHSSMFWKMKY